MKAEFESGAAHFWCAEFSQIYTTLSRMHRRKWLRRRVAASDKGPRRHLYERTAAGRQALLDWLRGEPEFGDERYAFVAQVYFLAEIRAAAGRIDFLQRLRDRLAERLAALQAVEDAWAQSSPEFPDRLPDEDYYPQLTLRLGLRVAEARLAWCDESIRLVEKRSRTKQPTP